MVLTTAPVEAFSSLTVSLPSFVTQTWVPSEETPYGSCRCPRRWSGPQRPSRHQARSPCWRPWFATQTWVPSEETPLGALPTAMVWTTEPVEASSSLTVLLGVRHPDVRAVRGDAIGRVAHGDGLDHRAGRGVQLGRRRRAGVRHPDVGAVGGDANGYRRPRRWSLPLRRRKREVAHRSPSGQRTPNISDPASTARTLLLNRPLPMAQCPLAQSEASSAPPIERDA